ncbi:C4-dicarboxylate TRAP transporter substrate-binding protein [Hoeflea poritis]|uniref:C4-dicarboxylate TRAP transporter substrate-binding protein n=1 Tax=Hoeflea poritis TaxID=2993659 RepID=A0ABT4VUQ7_9HYPH|nr:C4-dicarboxylate TRAP transporter substrate-binding protein [Hoeflea poritis]MDA4848446.1 C4-dicarboxylate TRAP transporter substrate-binding protein [Hoeflea poritis]
MNLFKSGIAALAMASFGFVAQPAQAETFNINVASGSPPVVPWVKLISDVFIPEVNARIGDEHTINWIESYSGTVAKVGGVLEAVESGLIEMGQVYAIFEQDKLILQNITYMTPFGSDDLELVTRMIGELHDEHPALKKAWEDNGQVFIAPIGLDTHYIATNFPVTSIDDLKGRKIGGAGTIANWLNGVGATAVDGNFSVHYNNIQTGVYDGLLNFSSGIFPNKLHEVAPMLTRVDFGAQFVGALTINKDTWDSFPEEVQTAFLEAGEIYRLKVSEALQGFARMAEGKMVEQGAMQSRLPEEERTRWAQALPDLAADWVVRAEAKGLPAQEILDAWIAKQADNGVALVRTWGQ